MLTQQVFLALSHLPNLPPCSVSLPSTLSTQLSQRGPQMLTQPHPYPVLGSAPDDVILTSATPATWPGVPDSHSRIMGHSAHHGGLGALDDTLVLGGLGDAGPGCKTR